jgi:Matrixin
VKNVKPWRVASILTVAAVGVVPVLAPVPASASRGPARASSAGNAGGEVFAFPPLVASDATSSRSAQALSTGASLTSGDELGSAPAALTATTGNYHAVAPLRIVDSRSAVGVSRKLTTNEVVGFSVVGGGAAVPANVTAVVVNVTMADPVGPGFMTAWAAGGTQPLASIINIESPGQAIANLVTVPVGTGGVVNLSTSVGTHVIVDLQGYYVPVASATAGRFVPKDPTRILDTRNGLGKVAAGAEIVVDVATLAGVSADVTAAVLKVTVADATAGGFWTVYPNTGTRPIVSNLNVAAAGDAISNQVIVPLSAGKIRIFGERGGHVIVDIVGTFTGATSPESTEGLFTPVTPGRALDSRTGNQKLGVRRTIEVSVANRFGIPGSGVAAVVLNTTIAPATNDGFLTVWPARTYRPNASSLNAAAGKTIAGHVITPVSTNGFAIFSDNGGQVIADVSGWYSGTPGASITPPHVPLYGPSGPSGAPKSDVYTFQVGLNASGAEVKGGGASVNPYRWNPCAPIRYRINLGGYGEQFRPVIEEAFDRLSSASGLKFVYSGESTYMPGYTVLNSPATAEPFEVSDADAVNRTAPYDLLVALGSSAATKGMVGTGGVLGVTYIDWFKSRAGVLGRIDLSSVTIDMPNMGTSNWSFDANNKPGIGPVLLHEFAHVVGLSHAADESQIMYYAVTANYTYQDGDMRGLWREGQGVCL